MTSLAQMAPRIPLAALLCLCLTLASPAFAADEPDAAKDGPKGAAVTVLKAAKFCFPNIVEVSGLVIPREETMVRPDRPGLKVAEIMADAGDSVTAGQALARLTLPEGGSAQVTSPVAGLIATSTATIGAIASARGEALFSIIARSEFDLVGQVPTEYLARLSVNQTARIKIIGAGEVDGKVRRVAPLSVPLTAVLYGSAGTVVQVVRRARVETKRVEVGLMDGGQIEIKEGLTEGDIVVARAGALLREGDPVRPVMAAAGK